uniref:Uncharacterized protein n=1 Tax=Halimeda discoidea TaxID=118222 RepID=A0A1C9JB68_9CHLO|nr:hypothetical protein [Halimeda discoidea]
MYLKFLKEIIMVILDKNNKEIVDNDLIYLIVIQNKLKKFCFYNGILGRENVNLNIDLGRESVNLNIDYCFTDLKTLLKDNDLIFCSKRYNNTYKNLLLKKNKYATLKDINGFVVNELSFKKERSKKYIYLETKNLFNRIYKKDNILMG